jgi:hypothetical protein
MDCMLLFTLKFHIGSIEFRPIQCRNFPFPPQKFAGLLQLRKPQSGAYVCHSIVIPDYVVPVLAMSRKALSLEVDGARVQRLIVGDHHPTLTGRDRLIAKETIGRNVAKTTHVLSLILGSECLRTVFNKKQ